LVTRSRRGWNRARQITVLPPDAAPNADKFLSSMTCTGAGTCLQVGQYADNVGGLAAMAAYEANGKWTHAAGILPPLGTATGLALNADPYAVSCVGSSYCLTVGAYAEKSGLFEPMGALTPPP
jgi:hypothetical protein